MEAGRQRVRQEIAGYLPQISGNASATRNETSAAQKTGLPGAGIVAALQLLLDRLLALAGALRLRPQSRRDPVRAGAARLARGGRRDPARDDHPRREAGLLRSARGAPPARRRRRDLALESAPARPGARPLRGGLRDEARRDALRGPGREHGARSADGAQQRARGRADPAPRDGADGAPRLRAGRHARCHARRDSGGAGARDRARAAAGAGLDPRTGARRR